MHNFDIDDTIIINILTIINDILPNCHARNIEHKNMPPPPDALIQSFAWQFGMDVTP